MKKFVFTIGLCLVATLSFGQKKVVAEALKLAKDAKPNFVEARTKIKMALEHPETKDDAKTWFTAGQIENMQFDQENTKFILGQQPNDALMYGALFEIYPYFEKAYQLDQLPDASGKVKPKFTKDMKSIIRANKPYYLNGGIYYFDEATRNIKKAYEFFDQYVLICDSKWINEAEKGDAKGATETVDSTYMYAIHYAAMAASLIDNETAIKAMTRAIKIPFNQIVVYQWLSQAYQDNEDMENYEKTLIEGLSLYPNEQFFLMRLIQRYVDTERREKAVEYINMAIQNDPANAQLHNLKGKIYEIFFKDSNTAEASFLKAIEIEGENAEYLSDVGRIYFNQGVAQIDIANEIADQKKYNEERTKALDYFRKALPFYEKAFSINPSDPDTITALRNIYYNCNMGEKFEEFEKLTN